MVLTVEQINPRKNHVLYRIQDFVVVNQPLEPGRATLNDPIDILQSMGLNGRTLSKLWDMGSHSVYDLDLLDCPKNVWYDVKLSQWLFHPRARSQAILFKLACE